MENNIEKNCYWHIWDKWEDIEISGYEHIKIRQIKNVLNVIRKRVEVLHMLIK
jgi:hypothetical protein